MEFNSGKVAKIKLQYLARTGHKALSIERETLLSMNVRSQDSVVLLQRLSSSGPK